MISVTNLSIEYSSNPIFTDISFFINPSEKIALVGKNGAGKTTLLKILTGLEEPTSGQIGKPADLKIGYLPQQMKLTDDSLLIDEVYKCFKERFDLEAELKELEEKILSTENTDDPEFFKTLERSDFIRNRIINEPLSEIEAEIQKTLLGLGFKLTDFSRPTSEFSGGWRMRIELAKILLSQPDLILLDEPTNHLDIESIQWLEEFLLSKAKAVMIVSHDRAFLDKVTKRTIEISCGQIYDYNVNYSQFVTLREERVEQQIKAFEKQQKEIEEIKDFIERFRYKATKAVQVQSRIKQLEKIKPIEIDEVDRKTVRIQFPAAARSGDFPLIINDVSKSYGDNNIFSDVNISLKRGEKVAFVGKNGEGKTTLVKSIMNQIPYKGEIKIGHNVKIGYFAQNQAQLLDENLTVYDTIDNVATGDARLKINDILGAFMFGGEKAEKKVKVLSGGEKTRLAMIKLLLEPVNFLILDEPTNHLDMKTKDVLKNALKNFSGTIITVSHDRDFLDGLVEKVYEFDNHKVREHIGGVYDFLRKKNFESLKDIEVKNSGSLAVDRGKGNEVKSEDKEKGVKKGAQSYKESKEKEKVVKKLKLRIKEDEEKIANLENILKNIEEKLSHGESSPEILKEYEETTVKLNEIMVSWENHQLELDDLIGNIE